MPQKSKCSPEEKVKEVENYLNGTKSQGQILQTHRIDKATLRSWVCLYKSAEKEGLTPQAVNKHYPVKRKEQVVTEYLAGEKAYLSAILDLKDRSIVSHASFKKLSGFAVFHPDMRNTTILFFPFFILLPLLFGSNSLNNPIFQTKPRRCGDDTEHVSHRTLHRQRPDGGLLGYLEVGAVLSQPV